MKIRKAVPDKDWKNIWPLVKNVFRKGDSFPQSPDITEKEAFEYWHIKPHETWVCVNTGGDILGIYYIKPNQECLGSHVSNCGYMVAEKHRNKGVAAKMCVHSLKRAKEMGFIAMQYNLVVSTNEVAVYLWKKMGFEIKAVLPHAFRHKELGFVDALVMYKVL